MTELETSNYMKIWLLVFIISTEAVRKKFDYEFHPKNLHKTLRSSKNMATLTRLHKGKHINKDQLKSITQSEASSADFDLTLMIMLLKNLADIQIGDILPVHGDRSEAADLTRIKFYRNFIAHKTDAAICEADFNSYWADIEQAVLRLSGNTLAAECEKLKLQECQPTEIGKCLKILSRLGDLEENLSQVTQEIADMKNQLERVANTLLSDKLEDCSHSLDQASFGRRQTHTEKCIEDIGDRATSISTVVSEGIKYLEETDLLLLTGKEGIGKTFNALEIIKHFCEKHHSFEMLQLSSQDKRGANYISNKEFCLDGNKVVLLDNFLGRDNFLIVCDDLQLLKMIMRKKGEVKIVLIVLETTKTLYHEVFTTSDLLSDFSVIDLSENMNKMTERERSDIIRKICTNLNDDETVQKIEQYYAMSEKEAALPLLCKMFTSVSYFREQGEMFFLNPILCVTKLVNLLREKGSSCVVAATTSANEDEDAIFFAVLIQILITEKLFVYQLFNDTSKNIENIIAVVFGKSLSVKEIELKGITNERNSSLICRTSEGKGVYYYLNNHLLRNALVHSFLSLGLQNVLPTLSLYFIVKYLKPSTERREHENNVTFIDEDDFKFICSRIIDIVCVDKINNTKGVNSVKTLCTSLFVQNGRFVDTLLQQYLVSEASVRKALNYEKVYLTSNCRVIFYFPAVLLKTIVKHGYNFCSVRILKEFLSTMLCSLKDDKIIEACSQTIVFTLSKECRMKNIQSMSSTMELIRKHNINYDIHTGSILHNACKSRDEQLIHWVLSNVDLEHAFTYIGRKIFSCSNTIDNLKFMLKVLQKRQTNQLYFYLMLEMVCDISHKDLAMYMFEHFQNEIIKGYCELYDEILEENALKSLLRELMKKTMQSWRQSNIHFVEWLLQNFKPNKEYFDMKEVTQFTCSWYIIHSEMDN